VGSDYEAYARRIAAEMARNGHPRLCAVRDVTQGDIADYTTVLEAAADERPLQEFLASRPGMLSQQLSTGCRWVIALPRLGAEYVPDFVIARLNSGGLHWTLVELESPRAGLFTRQGRKTRQLDAGTRQVSDWRDWIAANRDYAQRPKTAGGLGLPEIDHSARGLVIIGRRSAVTDDDRRRLKSVTFNERVNVHSYDWLIEEAAERIQHAANLARRGLAECRECQATALS
jgi:hypothetical protein